MDYEKKYKEALKRARQFSEHPLLEDSSNIVEYIFPELEESEDDRIRKEIIYHIQNCDDTIDEQTEKQMIAWLEKQGEQKVWENVEPVTEDDKLHLIMDEQKTTLSEEDEEMFVKIGEAIDSYYAPFSNDAENMSNWLNSLKERIKPQWKPSEEQLKALNTMNVTGCLTEVGQGKSLVELYEQLKKLKEE